MEEEKNRTSEINFKITLDENHVPELIGWQASEGGDKGDCKGVMISIWDAEEENTLRIDLWTKEMMVEEMKQFIYQTLVTTADSFERATNEHDMAAEMREFGNRFGEKMGIISRKS